MDIMFALGPHPQYMCECVRILKSGTVYIEILMVPSISDKRNLI